MRVEVLRAFDDYGAEPPELIFDGDTRQSAIGMIEAMIEDVAAQMN